MSLLSFIDPCTIRVRTVRHAYVRAVTGGDWIWVGPVLGVRSAAREGRKENKTPSPARTAWQVGTTVQFVTAASMHG